jgi:hypothetical protein
MTSDPAAMAKLDELLTVLRASADPRRAADEWKQVYRLLQKTELPAGRVTGVVGMRDVAGLAAMIDQLRAPAAAGVAGVAGAAGEEVPGEDVCREALRAFRKRMALTVLDEESKLGRSPLSKGASAGVPAIVPPNEWPDAVWQELVRQGKLRYIGHRFYELVKQP